MGSGMKRILGAGVFADTRARAAEPRCATLLSGSRALSSHPWPLQDVALKVGDLPGQMAFYRSLGFGVQESSPTAALLSAGTFHLTLRPLPDGRPRPPHTAGLFHFAILLHDRIELGSFLRHASRQAWNFVGAADHLVSEALYFSDPEGNGIEVYADRPRDLWQWSPAGEGSRRKISMDTLPLDLNALAGLPGPVWTGFRASTRLGHMHLTVGDLDRSQSFYESLGLHLTAGWGPFRFLSFDGYHHHIAINLVAGPNAAPVSRTDRGIDGFSLSRETVTAALPDPDGILLTPPQKPHPLLQSHA